MAGVPGQNNRMKDKKKARDGRINMGKNNVSSYPSTTSRQAYETKDKQSDRRRNSKEHILRHSGYVLRQIHAHTHIRNHVHTHTQQKVISGVTQTLKH